MLSLEQWILVLQLKLFIKLSKSLTEEPQDDIDPNAAEAIAGIKLGPPFVQ
jgi:hypothetical protein